MDFLAKFHTNTPQQNKDVVLNKITQPNGTLRIVVTTIALGISVDLQMLWSIYCFQQSGRGVHAGDDAHSIVYWKPINCKMYKKLPVLVTMN